jgi:5'-phosphate synthase pdxT subunit
VKIGILATPESLGGHIKTLLKCHIDVVKVERSHQLNEIDGLIISGEDNVELEELILNLKLVNKILKMAKNDFPIFGISEGTSILSKNKGKSLGLIDISVNLDSKNYYFQTFLEIPALGETPFKGVFTKDLYIEKVAPNVGILCKMVNGKIVFVRQGNFLVATFHPELAHDLRIHKYFIKIVKDGLT